MNLVEFSLKPFPDTGAVPGMAITGAISRRANMLSIGYDIRGDLAGLSIPARVEAPGRRDRLWADTCLELFLGVKGARDYWEFNLSPAGHWNVYRFASYREGMREEPAFTSLPFDVRTDPGALRLSLDADIGRIVPRDRTAEIGACAVIRTRTGETSHWALTHPGPRPDFHRRDGFRLNIAASS